MDATAEAARLLADARTSRTPIALLPEAIRPADEAAAYRVQDALHALLARTALGAQAGHKIGCTTAVMQRYLGIANPCAGGFFAADVHRSGTTLPPQRFRRVGIECEIAVRLGRDLPAAEAPFTPARAAAAIDSAMAAIELVDDRYVAWRETDTPTLIADDFFAAGCVLGAPVAAARLPDLATVEGTTTINGTQAGQGRGADVLGHPHVALAWLAGTLAARGRALRAGDLVLTGSLVQTVWLAPGDRAHIAISGLGTVDFALSPA